MYEGCVSIVIPARNEPYLKKTIQDILSKAIGEIEVIDLMGVIGVVPEALHSCCQSK